MNEEYKFDRDRLHKEIDKIAIAIKNNEFLGFPYFTYIAVSDDLAVYKIGRSRNPLKREGQMKGGYRHFNFKMVFYIALNIEYEILVAIESSGAITPLPTYVGAKRREAYYLTSEDVDYIVEKCGFKPISDFKEYDKDNRIIRTCNL